MTAQDALESGRQRVFLERAEQIKATLQNVPKSDTSRCIHLLIDLAGVLLQLERGTERLAETSQKAMWQKRAAWLRSELVMDVAGRLESPDAALFWENIALIVYISAGIRRDLLHDKDLLQSELETQKKELKEQQQEEEPQPLPPSNADSIPATSKHMKPGHVQQVAANGHAGGFSEEAMALRTKLVMVQQDLQRRTADVRDMSQQLQAALADRDKLQNMYDALRSSMDPAFQAVRERDALREHARTLSMNLESHARVVENLISLNSELMDAANSRAIRNDMKPGAEQASNSSAVGLDSGHQLHMPSGPPQWPLSTTASNNSSAREPPPFQSSRPEHSGVASALAQILQEEAPMTFDAPGHRARTEALALPAQLLSTSERQQETLSAGATEPKPARGGIFGSLSKAANLVLYVAGSPAAVERRAREMGQRTLNL